MTVPVTAPSATQAGDPPLVVDVDGTLIRTDLLHEATLSFIAHQPFKAWQPLVWLAGGKPVLKALCRFPTNGWVLTSTKASVASTPIANSGLKAWRAKTSA